MGITGVVENKTLYLEPRAMYDHAILRCEDGRLVYSADKIIEALIKDFKSYMDETGEEYTEESLETDALEYFNFNIECAYMGPFTPKYEWEPRVED